MVKKSSQVVNSRANGAYVLSSAQYHGDEVVEELARLEMDLPAEARLGEHGLRSMFQWLGAMLGHHNKRLTEAEMTYLSERADKDPVRTRRDDLVASLLTLHQSARSRIETSLGADELFTYSLDGRLPRVAATLVEHTEVIIQLLRDKPQVLPDALSGDLDTRQIASTLEETLAELRQTLADLTQEQREADSAMLRRNNALVVWRLIYRGVAAALTGLYLLAGREDLAQRIRPTSRRASGEEAPDDIPQDMEAPQPDDLDADPVNDEAQSSEVAAL
jgi:hypothetical protein